MPDTPPPRKKLIEVSLPLDAINKASAREKSIRHGHPSTLHLWWARRPLAACRAVLFASFVDDPESDPDYRRPDGSVDEERAALKRAELHNLIEDLVQWENSNNTRVINRARAEIARCVASRKIETGELTRQQTLELDLPEPEWTGRPPRRVTCTPWELASMQARPDAVNAFLQTHAPPVLDPFAGGGSIPLEAQRLGLRAHASDLNPVAVLINKALIEIPPKFAGMPPVHPAAEQRSNWHGAEGLAEDVRRYGQWMRDEAEKRIGELYPPAEITQDMATNRPELQEYIGWETPVLAYLWARTVRSPDPATNHPHTPLVSTFLVNSISGKQVWLSPTIDRQSGTITFTCHTGSTPPDAASRGTKVGRGRFRCLFSAADVPLADDYLKAEFREHRSGLMPLSRVVRLGRVKTHIPGTKIAADLIEPDFVTDLDCPRISGYFNPPIYGFRTMKSLFTPRQRIALVTFAQLAKEAVHKCREHGATSEYGQALSIYLALAIGRLANRLNAFSIWDSGRQTVQQMFSEQGVPMAWDFAEANPFSGASGSWDQAIDWIPRCLVDLPDGLGTVELHDATRLTNKHSGAAICSDPPYYSSITYADFADFFYGFHRYVLRSVMPDLFGTIGTPKEREAVAAWHRFEGDKGRAAEHFTQLLREAFAGAAAIASSEVPITIFYAFKQRESSSPKGELITAWESILEVVLSAGLAVEATWPMRTEQVSGRKAAKNSLASSIVLVCFRRPSNAAIASRGEFVQRLKERLPLALRRLQQESIAPVDLAQAAIGPGMAVFSAYRRVVTDGEDMPVREALRLIHQVLGESLNEQAGDLDPWSRWAIGWFEQYGLSDGPYGMAEQLGTAMNVSISGVEDAGVCRQGGGKVRLLRRSELDPDWDPAGDSRLTIWEVTQYLVRALEEGGEDAAAALLRQVGPGHGETARELAYRLYQICERAKWKEAAKQAQGYNNLVVAWPDIERRSREQPRAQGEQAEMFS